MIEDDIDEALHALEFGPTITDGQGKISRARHALKALREQASEANRLRQRVSDLIANANAREIDVNRLRANIERALQAIKEADAAAENRGLPIEGYTRQAIARALEALSK